jgi:hypothetical protein
VGGQAAAIWQLLNGAKLGFATQISYWSEQGTSGPNQGSTGSGTEARLHAISAIRLIL